MVRDGGQDDVVAVVAVLQQPPQLHVDAGDVEGADVFLATHFRQLILVLGHRTQSVF